MTKKELFLKLAMPNKSGVSRWVYVDEFIGEYKSLQLGNGGSWCRRNSSLAKVYIIEFDKSITSGNSIDAIRLNGYHTESTFSQVIRKDIQDYYKNQPCVMLGVCGSSENTGIEVVHKDGRKGNARISNPKTQRVDDFQPLSKAANDVKRQICKECIRTNRRWSAKHIKGNPYDFYEGTERYTEKLGCVGCYQYDPVEYRKVCVKRISNEICLDIMKKLYPEDL